VSQREDDSSIREQPMDDRQQVHRERVLVDEQFSGRQRRVTSRHPEVFIARRAYLLVACRWQIFERLEELGRFEKCRLFLQHLDVRMPHQHRIEKSGAGAGKTDEKDRRRPLSPPPFVAPGLYPRGRRCLDLKPEAVAI
jgi:hypothetical protein